MVKSVYAKEVEKYLKKEKVGNNDILKQYYDDIEYNDQLYKEHLLMMYGTPEEVKVYLECKKRAEEKMEKKLKKIMMDEREHKRKYERNSITDY